MNLRRPPPTAYLPCWTLTQGTIEAPGFNSGDRQPRDPSSLAAQQQHLVFRMLKVAGGCKEPARNHPSRDGCLSQEQAFQPLSVGALYQRAGPRHALNEDPVGAFIGMRGKRGEIERGLSVYRFGLAVFFLGDDAFRGSGPATSNACASSPPFCLQQQVGRKSA